MSIEYFERLQAAAERELPSAVARYFRQGSDRSTTADEAVAAWQRLRLLPHALTDVVALDTRTQMLRTPVAMPVAVAPSTFQRAAAACGEAGVARAVAASNSLLVLSSNAGTGFAEIGETGVNWWLQAYLTADRRRCEPVLERAQAAGARAIVLTADTPVVAAKDDGGGETIWDIAEPGWLRANFDAADDRAAAKAQDLGAADIEWLKQATGLPVVVKGVLRADDAARCVAAGADAIWVSNHGGRQLDGAAATADCLAAVVDAVGERAEVYVDGGIRSGRHVLEALALGARAALLGRPILWALAAGGEAQVGHALSLLGSELIEAMRLAGMRAPGPDRSLIQRQESRP